MADDDDREVMWAGGNWDPYPPPDLDPPKPPPEPHTPMPGTRIEASFGPSKRRGSTGLVAGRFLPLHRGHQYLIEFARASVDQLTILVSAGDGDEVPAPTRVKWLRELYPEVTVELVASALSPSDPEFSAKFTEVVIEQMKARRPEYFFSSELTYQGVAKTIGATFVPVDPPRTVMPISGTALRANVMENFQYLARSVRPWFVRRVAVVGAESTGKTTLCARLREQFKMLVVPEWTRVMVESGVGALSSDSIQLVARSQIASEDALANQLPDANGGILLCDTDLRTIIFWSQRLFEPDPPEWMRTLVHERIYDLNLICAPDIPFVGSPAWDQPEQRLALHEKFKFALREHPHVELRGTADERYQTACDAIIELFSPTRMLATRGRFMK
ncbi:MAG: AAA family ATPase [Kofleriaceae bacterium]